MNKKSLFVLCLCFCIIFITAFVLVGCSSDRLSSPRDLNVVDNNFVWSEVEGADGYMIYFNDDDGTRFFTWYNYLPVNTDSIKNSLKSGQRNMLWVRAVKLDKYGIPDLNTQSDRTRFDFDYKSKLNTPQRLDANNETSTLSWSKVDNATEYYAVVNGKEYKINHNITDTSTRGTISSLQNGNYELSIIAKADGYFDSDPSESIHFVQKIYSNGENDNPASEDWTVTFDLNYEGSMPITAKATDNKPVNNPGIPERVGYEFNGWYLDRYCLIEAGFTSTRSKFNITADTTLYAKWTAERITTTPVYFYTTDWAVVYAQIYNGEKPLFAGKGVLLNVMDGKQNWFRANIDDRTTSIVFTNGDDLSLEALDFDKSLPYCKNSCWTADMPSDNIDNPDIGQYIYVNGVKYNLKVNPDSEPVANKTAEYMITINLEIGDVVELKSKSKDYVNYEPECNFKGIASANGEHTFYVKLYNDGGDAIWVECPTNGSDDEGTTIYYKNVYHYPSVYVYTWGDNGETNPWPGIMMTAVEGHEDWYSTIVPNNATMIIFSDGASNQTDDLTIDRATPYYNGYAWVNDFVDDRPDPIPDPNGITIYFYNSINYSNIHAYAWGSSGNAGAWPGKPMTAVEGHDGWYSITVPEKMTMIIFNNGKSGTGNQTDDLTINKANPYYNGSTWVSGFTSNGDAPNPPAEITYKVIVNGSEEVILVKTDCDDPNVTVQYSAELNLVVGDKIKVVDSNGKEFANYEQTCTFKGTANTNGKHTLYFKLYVDNGDSIWVTEPATQTA